MRPLERQRCRTRPRDWKPSRSRNSEKGSDPFMDLHMRTRVSVAGVCSGAMLLWLAVMATTIRPAGVMAQESGGRKIWDGIYTKAQADRGKPAFEQSCGRCHNNELVGSEREPALKGDG